MLLNIYIFNEFCKKPSIINNLIRRNLFHSDWGFDSVVSVTDSSGLFNASSMIIDALRKGFAVRKLFIEKPRLIGWSFSFDFLLPALCWVCFDDAPIVWENGILFISSWLLLARKFLILNCLAEYKESTRSFCMDLLNYWTLNYLFNKREFKNQIKYTSNVESALDILLTASIE